MRVLIITNQADLGSIWKEHLERQGANARLVPDASKGIEALTYEAFDALILNLDENCGDNLGLSDFATYRNPDIAIIVVTSNGFFSDGSIFSLVPNTCSVVDREMAPSDLVAVVEHYAR